MALRPKIFLISLIVLVFFLIALPESFACEANEVECWDLYSWYGTTCISSQHTCDQFYASSSRCSLVCPPNQPITLPLIKSPGSVSSTGAYCVPCGQDYSGKLDPSRCEPSTNTQTFSIPNADCISKATIGDTFFDDGGQIKIGSMEICSKNCADASPGPCSIDNEDLTETIQSERDGADVSLKLTNQNLAVYGKTTVTLMAKWADPDVSDVQCGSCASICASGNPWCVNNNLNKRKWIEDEDMGNACCGDDKMTGNPLEDGVTIDNPDKSKSFCTQCPKSGSDDRGAGNRIWLGDDAEAPSLGFNLCCGDDPLGAKDDQDDPDRSTSSCNKCKIGGNNQDPSIRSWDPSVQDQTQKCCGDDVDTDDPDSSLIHCEGKGGQKPCPIGELIEGRVWGDDAKQDPRNKEHDQLKADVGCCGDDKKEKWCAGESTDGGCLNDQFFGPGYEDIDNTELDPEGFMCTSCTTRKTSSGSVEPGVWFPQVLTTPAVVVPGAPAAPPIAPTATGAPCCGDDPGETWCVDQNSGCYSTGEITDVVTEPDENAWLCVMCASVGTTPSVRAWDANAFGEGSGCCGDDAQDCGQQAAGRLCGNIDGETTWAWSVASDQEGNIQELPCNNKQYVALSNRWSSCDGASFSDQENGNLIEDLGTNPHDYLCSSDKIYECCGDGDCNSDGNAGEQRMLGESVSADGSTYYCSSDGKWKTNLDDDQQTCEVAVDENQNPLIWTGKYCCSEAEDHPEYYNDEDSIIGGCWNSQVVSNGQAIDYQGTTGIGDIVVSNGIFEGCKVAASNFNKENDAFLAITDTQTGDQVIHDHDYCSSIDIKFSPDMSGIQAWCSYQEEWRQNTFFDSRPQLSSIIWRDDNSQIAECCPTNNCWIGNYSTYDTDAYSVIDGCIEDMSGLATEDAVFNAPDEHQYRCIKGNWQVPNLKTSPSGKHGFCQQESQCLVDPLGDPTDNGNTSVSAFPVCVNDKQYLESTDFLCVNGGWTSRTQLIAQQMVKIVTTNYTLACGSSDEMLNFIDYFSNKSMHMTDYLFYVNNLCVMKTDDSVIVGTSLNRPVDSTFASFLEAIDKPLHYCDAAKVKDGNFKVCSGSDAYYNDQYNLLIFSQNSISFGSSDIWASFLNQMTVIEEDILPTVPSEVFGDMSLFKQRHYYNGIYLDKHDDKEINGMIEAPTLGESVIGVSYTNPDTSFCTTINQFNDDNHKKIFCTAPGVNTYVLTSDPNSPRLFPELTYKLRVS